MKKISLSLALIWLCIIALEGQYQPQLTSPWGTSFVHYYDCGGQETHTYVQDFLVHKLENLTYGMYYISLGQSSSVFDIAYHEFLDYNSCISYDVHNYWRWDCSTPGTDSIVLIIEGENENLVAGSSEWIPLTIRPPDPWDDETESVLVSVVAPYYISGPSLACSSPVSFDLINVPSTRTSVSWQIKQGSSVISSGTGNTASTSISSNGNYQVIFTMDFACGLNDLTYTKDFHFGPYSSSDYEISGPSSASCNSFVAYSIPDLAGITSIDWDWPEEWSYGSGQGTRWLDLQTGLYSGTVMVGVDNECGQHGSYDSQYTNVYGYCGYSIIINPNPSSNLINITIKEPSSHEYELSKESKLYPNSNDSQYKITIMDRLGNIYNSFTALQKEFELSVLALKNGNYIISATRGDIIFSSQFIVKH